MGSEMCIRDRRATDGFLEQILISPLFSDWDRKSASKVNVGGVYYSWVLLTGSFDSQYPERPIVVSVATVTPVSYTHLTLPTSDLV